MPCVRAPHTHTLSPLSPLLSSHLLSRARACVLHRAGKSTLPDECKLYVGNLPPAYNADMLRQLFEPHGNVVHSAVITEPGTNASRGFGFVHIPDIAQVRGACARPPACVWARLCTHGSHACSRRRVPASDSHSASWR